MTVLLTNLGGVVGRAKDQFGSTIVAGTDVRDIWLVFNQDFGAAEVAQLQDSSVRIKQKVLRLDIAVADTLRMDVCK